MTPAEIGRAIESKNRIKRIEAQEKASYDYIQASLIVKGVSIMLGEKTQFPTIQQAYPNLFDDVIAEQEKKLQEQKVNLSTLRFLQYANFHNKKYKEVAHDK